MARNPRINAGDVPRRPSSKVGSDGPMAPKRIDIMDMQKAKKLREQNKDKAMGIPSDFKIMVEEAEINMAKGGYVCPPNKRKGNIDMRKTGMTRSTKDNRKYKKG